MCTRKLVGLHAARRLPECLVSPHPFVAPGFDEIDAGIGGQTGFEVGRKLKSVASFNQVICITHLPQVAAFADHHLVVQKTSSGARTQTTVVELAKKERKEEIARMLGGPNLTKKSLENAAELLETAQK